MQELILIIAEIINSIHDIIMDLSSGVGLNLTDKDLHLWVFGIIGILTFVFVHIGFKFLSKYSLTAISFVYTFTVMVVLVFAIEIQQKITGRGQMEFDDAVIGLWGFLLFFAVFLLLKWFFKLIVSMFNKDKSKTKSK